MADRSVSRGRDNYTSSGRGGLGNIRPASQSRDRPTDGPDDFSSTRGRELPPASTTNKIISTGRGGLGNLRSPSRDAAAPINDQEELRILREHSQEKRDAPISTGRGGAGNINRSRSRETAHATNVGQGGHVYSLFLTDLERLARSTFFFSLLVCDL
ncbi:hypothetical protein DL96DRAFT_664571 [Flagelloscypha sp. PMI_526]|nr:hypothetical protein DL96DRAFT_664571 [Flagelloscypha sp. PMI_526]